MAMTALFPLRGARFALFSWPRFDGAAVPPQPLSLLHAVLLVSSGFGDSLTLSEVSVSFRLRHGLSAGFPGGSTLCVSLLAGQGAFSYSPSLEKLGFLGRVSALPSPGEGCLPTLGIPQLIPLKSGCLLGREGLHFPALRQKTLLLHLVLPATAWDALGTMS